MIRVCFFIAAVLFFECSAYAQPAKSIKVNGVITYEGSVDLTAKPTALNLTAYKMGDGYFNSRIDSTGAFSFEVPLMQAALYELRFKGLKLEVLLCPTEAQIKIEIKVDNTEVKSMKVVGSHEYDAYREFKGIDKAFKDKLRNLLPGCDDDNACSKKLKKESEDFNSSLEYLRKVYTGTFAAEVLAPMDEMPEINTAMPAIAQLREHFFDKANLSDASVYVTPEINYNLSIYIQYLADTSAQGRMDFIKALSSKTQSNKNAQREFMNLLFTNFIEESRESYLWSLSHWADANAVLLQDQQVILSKLRMLSKTLPGMEASPVSGMDINNEKQELLPTVKKNKLTLLIFWASDCPHCRASMPDIIKLYEQYHAQGLEIFAVSLEQNKEEWKAFVKEKKLEWTNVLLAQGDYSPADYFLQSTPALTLINNNGVILHRFMSIPEFNKSIGEILKK